MIELLYKNKVLNRRENRPNFFPLRNSDRRVRGFMPYKATQNKRKNFRIILKPNFFHFFTTKHISHLNRAEDFPHPTILSNLFKTAGWTYNNNPI